MKKKTVLMILMILLAAVLLAVLRRKPLYHLYREIEFHFREHTPAAETVHAYARENHIPYGEYPYDIIGLLDTNPETLEFVVNYPFRKGPDTDLSSYSRDTVPLFLQWDQKWGYEPYGSSCLAVTGCGPTALAMAGYYLTGEETMNPLDVAKFAEANGYYAPGYGSSWTLISEGGPRLGLTVQELPLMKSKLEEALEAGDPVILALGKGDFTSAGHYIVLTGTEEGGFRVNDPNSPDRSARLWTYETLEPQIRNIWRISR